MIKTKRISMLLLLLFTMNIVITMSSTTIFAYWDILEENHEYNGFDYTDNPILAQKIEDVMYGRVKLFLDTDYTYPVGGIMDHDFHQIGNRYHVKANCDAYGRAVFYYLFGETLDENFVGNDSIGELVIKDSYEANYQVFADADVNVFSVIVTNALPVEMMNPNYDTENVVGHLMILLDYDEVGITVLSGNITTSEKDTIGIQNYTWDEFQYYLMTSRNCSLARVYSPCDEYLNDTTAPEINSIDIVRSDIFGYTVNISASDNVRVKEVRLAASSPEESPEDSEYQQCVYNPETGKYTIRVLYSEHGNSIGEYTNRIVVDDYTGSSCETEFTAPYVNTIYSSEVIHQTPDNYGFYNGHLYIYYDDIDTYLTAEAFARNTGSYLATISSEEENQFISDLVSEAGGEAAFIGYRYTQYDNKWCWSNGENSEYFHNEINTESDNLYTALVVNDEENPSKWEVNNGGYNQVNYTCGFVVELSSFDFYVNESADFNGNRYYVSNKNATYDQAVIFAESLGGHIVEITSSEENDFVYNLASRCSNSEVMISFPETNYSNWAYDSGRRNHVCMLTTTDEARSGKWVTRNCDWYSSLCGFVVEVEGGAQETVEVTPTVIPTVVPEPTAIPTPVITTNPTVVPTPVVTPTSVATPTVIATPTPAESDISRFAERLYTCALNRNSDSNGKQNWINELLAGRSGADVAYGFFFSDEVINSNISNGEFINRLYKTFMDRDADEGGFNYWIDRMNSGANREDVFYGFVNSVEWANICLSYGINSGGSALPNITISPSDEVVAFATRLYTTCLGRNADSTGLNDWANRLANRRISGSQAARGFFFSDELIAQNLSDGEFISRLYRTFMNRNADDNGFNYWLGQMNSGATREDVFNGFANSAEWARICADSGIVV